MRTFTIIWFAQLVSTISSYMTRLAPTLWAWKNTARVAAITLVSIAVNFKLKQKFGRQTERNSEITKPK